MDDHRSAYNPPVHPADPDPWHDRRCGFSLVPPIWFSLALLIGAICITVWSARQ